MIWRDAVVLTVLEHYLQSATGMSAVEVSTALGCSVSTARHWLDAEVEHPLPVKLGPTDTDVLLRSRLTRHPCCRGPTEWIPATWFLARLLVMGAGDGWRDDAATLAREMQLLLGEGKNQR